MNSRPTTDRQKKKRSPFRKHIRKADGKTSAKAKQSHRKPPATIQKPQTKPSPKTKQVATKPPAKAKASAPHSATKHIAKPAVSTKRSGGVWSKVSARTKQAHGKPSHPTKKPDSKPTSKAKQAASKPPTKTKPSVPRTEAQYLAKPEKFKDTWERVINVISKMRTGKVSLTQASRDAGISPRTVNRWGGAALQKRKNGKYVAKQKDNLLRLVMIPTPEGTREIAVRGSKQVTLLAEYWNAVHRYLQTGEASRLKLFRGKYIKDADGVDVPLPTGLSVLNRLGSAGVLSFESLYARTA